MKSKHFKLLSSFVLFCFVFTNLIFFGTSMQTFAANGKTKLIIHYAKDPSTDKDWNLWLWPDGKEGKKYEFTGKDDFGVYSQIEFDEELSKVGFIVRTDSWQKDVDQDRFVTKFKDGVAEIWLLPGDADIYYSKPSGVKAAPKAMAEEVKMTVHYYRYDNNYEGWNLWVWPNKKDGKAFQFTETDFYGKVAKFTLTGAKDADSVGLIVRKSVSGNDWAEKEFGDRVIKKFKEDGSIEVWLLQADEGVYFSDSDVDRSPRFLSAKIDEMNIINIETNAPFEFKGQGSEGFVVKSGNNPLEIKTVKALEGSGSSDIRKASIELSQELPLNTVITVERPNYKAAQVSLGKVMSSETFEKLYFYDGNDLGNIYAKDKTSFKLWAPTASEANLVVYSKADDKTGKETPMVKGEKGTWSLTLDGDQAGTIYTYKVKLGDKWNEAVDPYVRSVAANGDKGVVVDLKATNPKVWKPTSKPALKNAMDTIIYELHVRDLSIQPESGIKNKGKFLGLTETGTKGPNGTKTGLDHIKDLGVTHVQLLPIFDYNSLDETKDTPQFNWGYDPKNYNAPEGTYSTDAANPVARVKELKETVQALHDNNLRVIMDVVYNHMYDANASNFNKLVPGYFFRLNENGTLSNGSGVGNDTASEHKMMRKFMVDSITYWAKEYNLDGFRFDLMGIHDVDTMNEIRAALDKIDPSIIILGEGWNLGTNLPVGMKAYQLNAYEMPRIAQFNDTIRDGIKGSVFNKAAAGFVNGKEGMETQVKKGIVGGVYYNDSISDWGKIQPDQTINYVEAHDNNTLWDKLSFTNPDASEEARTQMHKMADTIILTSQGIPFIHAGQEFMRTKGGNENSYNTSDEVNRLDWARKAENMAVVDYFKGLIELRKSHPAFRMTTAEMIQKNLSFIDAPNNLIAYTLSGKGSKDKWSNIVVAFNANKEPQTVKLPKSGTWKVVVDGNKAGTKTLSVVKGDTLTVPAYGSMVLYNGTNNIIVISLMSVGIILLIAAMYFVWRKQLFGFRK